MNIKYRKLTISDKPELKKLVDDICFDKNDSIFFMPYTEEEYENYIGEVNGVMIGVFDNDKLIGFGALLKESEDKYELDGCIIKPEYRNMGLQKELINKRIQFAKKNGANNISVMAHPENLVSLNNLKKCGFSKKENKILPNGKPRTIMELNLN